MGSELCVLSRLVTLLEMRVVWKRSEAESGSEMGNYANVVVFGALYQCRWPIRVAVRVHLVRRPDPAGFRRNVALPALVMGAHMQDLHDECRSFFTGFSAFY